ncbi:MAG: MATE family efflux transporter [Proteobacteria bacterium]|nr:MATE family efflux transporter [Pseudomonadota bacterium]
MSSTASTPSPDRPLIELPAAQAVWKVAWPMIAIGMLKSAYFLTDSYFVGLLGPKHLAALGGAAFAWWMIWICTDLASVGTHALSARHEGAGTSEEIRPVLAQGMWVALCVAAALAFAAYPIRHVYFDLLGFAPDSEEYRLGMEFLGASLLGAGTLCLSQVIGAVFRGLGDTRTALQIATVTLVLNAALDPVFIWTFDLGIAGAAWATATSNAAGALFGLSLLMKRSLGPARVGPAMAAMRRIFKIGLPIAASGVGFSLVYVFLSRFINDFGTQHMAGLGVGHRIESLGYMYSIGMMTGVATMVGQHLGAQNPAMAARCAHVGATICGLSLLPMAAVLYVSAPALFEFFTDDPVTAAAGVHYLRIQLLVLALMGVEVAYEGAFSGAGDTMPTFWITFVFTGARIPGAWYLAYELGWGIGGVWWAIAISTALKGVVIPLWFARNKWTTALET